MNVFSEALPVIQIQMRMLAANHQTEHWDPNEGAREGTEEAERVCNPMGRTTLSTKQTLQNFQGLKHQPKSTLGETYGSSCICSRG